jgi:hypothetical protein
MDRRSTKSLWRDYGVPMQDPKAFSLQYGKDTTHDPSKPIKKKPTKKVDYTDHTGLLKIQKPKKAQEGLRFDRLPRQAPDRVRRSWEMDPELLYPDKFNIKLTPEEEARYQQWLKGPGKDAVWDQPAYDVRGAWKDQGEKIAPGHGADTWKKPNHPTFSTESIYANQRQYPAATWEEDGGYSPSEFSKGLYSKEYYKRMFAKERERDPSRPEHLDKYNTGGKMIGLLKKGGKVGDPKNRKKPGGSNVGKYSKSEGPFAGPSGGAPSGSYPIGSKSRGKSALKLAHNAPNPSGIKAAVYRKYPELKTKKAAYGAKLGLLGMGQMQGKAPIPTDRNAPADKVHTNFKMTKRKRKEPKTAFPH